MALIIENGSGVRTANSYITVAEYKAYHTARGADSVLNSEFTDPEIEYGIIKATDYIEQRFGRLFKGC